MRKKLLVFITILILLFSTMLFSVYAVDYAAPVVLTAPSDYAGDPLTVNVTVGDSVVLECNLTNIVGLEDLATDRNETQTQLIPSVGSSELKLKVFSDGVAVSFCNSTNKIWDDAFLSYAAAMAGTENVSLIYIYNSTLKLYVNNVEVNSTSTVNINIDEEIDLYNNQIDAISGTAAMRIYSYDAPPTYSGLSSSSTVAGSSCQFNTTFNDDVALETNGRYIFETNNTGSWVAESAINFTSTPQTVSVSKTLNTTSGNVVSYRWNFTDNAGYSNTTGIQSITLTAGTAPTMGGFEAPSTAYGNTYFWVNVTVNDVDGIQQIKNASVELSYGVVLGWDNATGVFSEVADPGGFCTLDAGTSTTTDLNSTAIEVSWYIQFNTEYQDGSVDVVAVNTKAFDTASQSGSSSSVALFQFNDNIGGGGGGGGGGGDDSGSGTVNPISDPPKVITDIAEALNISPLGVYAILGALGLITLGGITATTVKVRKGRKSNPKRQYRG